MHVRRTRFVSDRLYELLRVRNYHQREVELVIDLHFDADFADLFEVRGSRRRRSAARASRRRPATDALTLSYLGLDEVSRQTVVRFTDPPESIKQGRARFRLRLRARRARRHPLRRPGGRAGRAGARAERRLQRASSAALRHEHERWESAPPTSSPTTTR